MILTRDLTEDEIIILIKCYIMILFSNLLFHETTGNTVNIMYLPLLSDITKIGTYG